MLKKVLIGVGIVTVIAAIIIGVTGYKAVQIVNDKLKEKEPEFRQYITMTVEQQNAYVEKNLDELLNVAISEPKNAQDKDVLEKIKAAPDAKAAGIEVGRALIATIILSNDEFQAEMKDDIKAKFEKEADEFSSRLDKYSEVLKQYELKK